MMKLIILTPKSSVLYSVNFAINKGREDHLQCFCLRIETQADYVTPQGQNTMQIKTSVILADG